jgi:Questin oxidase-like
MGLAQVAVHGTSSAAVIPRTLFKANPGAVDPPAAHEQLTSLMPSLISTRGATNAPTTLSGTHVFTIMARMLKDPNIKIKKSEWAEIQYAWVSKTCGDLILRYAEQCTLDTSDPKNLERKFEELVWMNNKILHRIPY